MALRDSIKATFSKWFGASNHGRADSPRPPSELAELKLAARQRQGIDARYDAASHDPQIASAYANADGLDADSANSRPVRETLVQRSRLEASNNGFYAGIAHTYATDCISCGPKLRMESSDQEFNRTVEREWSRWAKAVGLRPKLLTMAHAKHVDGEGIGVCRTNPKVRHRVKLDVVLYETEQCQTPNLPFAVTGKCDGVSFDEWGNPEYYDILQHHPGGQWSHIGEPEQVPARYVLHWFKRTRPNQHRGVPECAATLNVGMQGRRFREATIGAAEKAADIAVLLGTPASADVNQVQAFTSTEFSPNMITALPLGYSASQIAAEHPNSTFESFNKALVSEMARPKSMPLNKAMCDSSSYNYASGRLDHQSYNAELDSDRADCDTQVLEPLFEVWFEEAVLEFGWNPPDDYSDAWDWPQHPVVDLVSEATANQLKLQSGELSLSSLYAANGEDFNEAIERMARDYDVEVKELRKILLINAFNSKNQQASYMTAVAGIASKAASPQETQEEEGTDAGSTAA